eukprot:2049511-Pleurochrysis_carterae.AAC.2
MLSMPLLRHSKHLQIDSYFSGTTKVKIRAGRFAAHEQCPVLVAEDAATSDQSQVNKDADVSRNTSVACFMQYMITLSYPLLLRRAHASASLCTIDEMYISSIYRYTTNKTTSSESPST